MNDYCLQIRNLEKSFAKNNVLSKVNLNLAKGEIIGLVGPNGAGKTTLIKLIMGLLHPDAGSIKIFGEDRNRLSRDQWRRVGYVADEPVLYDFMSIGKLIDFNKSFYPEWDENRCSDLLLRFHLPATETIKNLSRGMKTQLSLILTLVQKPDLLILDEPLDGLDPLRRLEFLNLVLEEFSNQEGRSILISSHYLEELERVTDRIAFLQNGEIKRIVTTEQLKVEEKTIRVVFQKEPPDALLKMPGIKAVQKEGKTGYLVTIEDNFHAIYEAYCSYPHYVLEIYHRNLEDMFYDYAGGGENER